MSGDQLLVSRTETWLQAVMRELHLDWSGQREAGEGFTELSRSLDPLHSTSNTWQHRYSIRRPHLYCTRVGA